MARKMLVTGGAGFIGSHVADRFLEEGYDVTILDNLTTRLEYIEGTAQSSREAEFFVEENEARSLVLRWEIVDPLPVGQGGIVRFRARVR